MYLSKCVCQIVFVKMIIIMIVSYMTIYDAANFLTDERTDKAILGVGYVMYSVSVNFFFFVITPL